MAELIAHPVEALSGAARVPGDKSISHRALMLGALAVGESRITGLLEGEDVLRTAAAMRLLGAQIEHDPSGTWRLYGRGVGGLVEPADVLDLGNSGTGARLLMGLLAGHPITAFVTGDASLRRRPMNRVAAPLGEMGARILMRRGGLLPACILGAADPLPIRYRLPVASAQVKSAVLLAGLCAAGETQVIETAPTRDHSERMLAHFGASIKVEESKEGRLIRLAGQPELAGREIKVPADPSSAAFPTVAALLLPGSDINLPGVGTNPGRFGLYVTLAEMGAKISYEKRREDGGEPVADLRVVSSRLHGVEVPPERAPTMIDEYPILAIAAAAAEGVTVMRGLGELRVKESDRLAAIAAALSANGVKTEIGEDSLTVHGCGGRPPGGGTVETHYDHRIAMAALILGLASEKPVTAREVEAIDTSFPGFAALMNGLGARIETP